MRLLIFFIGIFFWGTNHAQIQFEARDSLPQKIEQILAKYEIPAMAVALTNSSEIIYSTALGKRKLGAEEKVQIDDPFHIGSNTKAMTAYLAAALVEEGKIAWGTKFFDLFPTWKEQAHPAYASITLVDLFRHQAFIQPYTEDVEWQKIPKETTEDIIHQRQLWAQQILALEPVSIDETVGYHYSNAGYTLATTMLEKVNDLEYETLMQIYVFAPLEIKADFGWPNTKDANQVYGHYIQEEDSVFIAHKRADEYEIGRLLAPAGDVHISIIDYCKFLQANLSGLNGNSTHLSSKNIQYLHTKDENSHYAVGWGVGKVKFGDQRFTLSTHTGSAGTFYSETMLIPELDIAFAIFINSGEDYHYEGMSEIRTYLFKAIRKEYEKTRNFVKTEEK